MKRREKKGSECCSLFEPILLAGNSPRKENVQATWAQRDFLEPSTLHVPVKSQECAYLRIITSTGTLYKLQIDRTPIVVLVSEPTVELILEFARKHWKFCSYNRLGFATGCWCNAAKVVKNSSKAGLRMVHTVKRTLILSGIALCCETAGLALQNTSCIKMAPQPSCHCTNPSRVSLYTSLEQATLALVLLGQCCSCNFDRLTKGSTFEHKTG